MPRDRASSSLTVRPPKSPSGLDGAVTTWLPRLPATMAVPVSWHIGSTPPAAMLALRSRSSATNLSFGEACGSSRIELSWRRCEGRR